MAALNMLDIGVLLIAFGGALFGLYKGFVFSLLSFAGKILSAILTMRFVGRFMIFFNIKGLFLKGTAKIIKEYIPLTEGIKKISIKEGNIDFNELMSNKNLFVKIMGKNISREIEHLYEAAEKFYLETLGDLMSLVIANYVINILSFIVLFLIFLIGFSLLRIFLVKLIGVSNLATGVDKTLGFVFGMGVNIFILAFVLGVSFDFLNLINLKDGGLLNNYKLLINNSVLKDYLYYFYSLIINEGIKLL